ncbi:MAG: hypothetical protein ACXACR_17140, partial [Candidatus Hodarchaeales archaeon]
YYTKYLAKGSLLFLLLLFLITTSAIHPDNTIYPINNMFAFEEGGTSSNTLYNQSLHTEEGMTIHEIMSEQPVYKFRFILTTPQLAFEVLSLRMRMIFTDEISDIIRYGNTRNVTISIYPFELTSIDGINNSVQVLDALDMYHGTSIQFKFNTTAFEEVEYFELAFSSWNVSTNIKGIQFEQIRFHLAPTTSSVGQILLVIFSTIGLFGFWTIYPQRFGNVLAILFVIIMLIMPLALITQVQHILDALPEGKEEGVTRFTFFNQVYERRDLGNGLFSLRMVKDLSTAFELQALSGTGSQVVYPMIEENIEETTLMNETEDNELSIGEESSLTLIGNLASPISRPLQFQDHFLPSVI